MPTGKRIQMLDYIENVIEVCDFLQDETNLPPRAWNELQTMKQVGEYLLKERSNATH